MSGDTPLADAIKNIPKNELDITVTDSKDEGPKGRVTFEREHPGGISDGVFAEAGKQSGWGFGAFFKKVWK